MEEYSNFFADASEDAKYIYESTPHYFRAPRDGLDVAKRIREGLGDIPLILMLRHPVDRYLSAYTHHMMRGKVPEVEEIEAISNDLSMFDFGKYATILTHFKMHFSTIHVHLYDELVENPVGLTHSLFSELGVDCDLLEDEIRFRTNDKNIKARKIGKEHGRVLTLPVLSSAVRRDLFDAYRGEISDLARLHGLPCEHWLDYDV